MGHLLVTNDFPPKVGGIQSYLWELWRRLPPERATVLTGTQGEWWDFDAGQALRINRLPQAVLLPTPEVVRHVRQLADQSGASLVVVDPALPLGLIGPRCGRRYCLVLHGAEVTVPARLPGSRALLRSVLRGATHVIAAGRYPMDEACRVAGDLSGTVIPPGVDTDRFRPLDPAARAKARAAVGLPPDAPVVLGLSRLVPRKGFDVLIAAAALLAPDRPDLVLAIAGVGRDRDRLERLAAHTGAPARFLGLVDDADLPAVVGSADVFAMPCRSRWAGLEQEGFGIVFLEAAACGVPQVAGSTGGAQEAVADGETGLVVRHPDDPVTVAGALARLLDDTELRTRLGRAARRRAEKHFGYDRLAADLDATLLALEPS